MWDEEALNKLRGSYLPIKARSPRLSVVYLYGRSWNTPLDVVTPVDVLQDALGMDRLESVLDIEGIRTYRTGEGPMPLHVLLTSQENRLWPDEDSPGWPQTLDFSPFLPLLIRVRMVERNGVEAAAAHLCGDILDLLRGLDDRMEEYEKALARLEEFCAANRKQDTEADRFLAVVERDAKRLRARLANPFITGVWEVSDAAEVVKECLGTSMMLWDRDEFYRFWDLSALALSERQDILTKYRDFVKEVRNSAGMAVTQIPEGRAVLEKMRKLTQNVLRKRYYLEGDWRGENPL